MDAAKTIGIIGGGQLGRMLTLAALPLGFKVVVVDPNEHSPAAQVGAEQIVADLYDASALRLLAKRSDFITVEIEHLDTLVLDDIARHGTPVSPTPSTIRLIQDKLTQKQFLQAANVPVASFVEITDEQSVETARQELGGKMLLKTRHGAYDGRGNRVISRQSDIAPAFKYFAGKALYAEQFLPFVKELAVMIARSSDGTIAVYPVVETVQARSICIEVLAPAPIDKTSYRRAEQIARKVAGLLTGAGVFGIEMFLMADGKIVINEIAPRVHNSGHYTIEATRTSQFEQHIRAITGLPLGRTDMLVPTAVMINILGERDGLTDLRGVEAALSLPHVSVHLYGKSPTKVDRKMGHITATGNTLKEVRKRARLARRKVSI